MQTLLEVLGSLRELGSEGLASGLALIVGRIVANDGIDDIDARLVGIGLPVVHPLALGPRIRAKEDDLLIAEGLLDLVPHRLELVILKLLGTHGGQPKAKAPYSAALSAEKSAQEMTFASAPAPLAPSATRFAMASVLPVPLQ